MSDFDKLLKRSGYALQPLCVQATMAAQHSIFPLRAMLPSAARCRRVDLAEFDRDFLMRHVELFPHLYSFPACDGHPHNLYASRTWASAVARAAKVQLHFALNPTLPAHLLRTRTIPSSASKDTADMCRACPQVGWLC